MKMRRTTSTSAFAALAALLIIAGGVNPQTRSYPKAKVSFSDFKNLVGEVESHRDQRLVNLGTFLTMAKERIDRLDVSAAIEDVIHFANSNAASITVSHTLNANVRRA